MYLLLDYSSTVSQAILRHNGKTLGLLTGAESKVRQALQAGKLGELLRENGAAPGDLDFAVCGLGPGSFSGVRSALCALVGLTLPHGKPLRGVSSAVGCAVAAYRAASRPANRISVVGDARRNRLWAVNYTIFPDFSVRLENGGAPSHSPSDFALIESGKLAETVPPDALVISPDFDRLAPLLSERFGERLLPGRAMPDIESLALAVEASSETCTAAPAPIYLQPAVTVLPGGRQ